MTALTVGHLSPKSLFLLLQSRFLLKTGSKPDAFDSAVVAFDSLKDHFFLSVVSPVTPEFLK